MVGRLWSTTKGALTTSSVRARAEPLLGSYPAAGAHAHSARQHADARWREADEWVQHLREAIR